METRYSSYFLLLLFYDRFPLGSGINGNFVARLLLSFPQPDRFPLGSGINGNLKTASMLSPGNTFLDRFPLGSGINGNDFQVTDLIYLSARPLPSGKWN